MTIGITFTIIGIANYLFGPTLKTIPLPPLLSGSVDLGFRSIAAHRVFAILCGGAVAAALWYSIERTAFGVKLRASVDNAAMAAALGVRTKIVYAVSFAIAVGLAAFGGIVGAELLPIEPYYALRYMVTFLVVVSVGGAGLHPRRADRLPAARRHRHGRALSDAGIRRVLLLPRGHRHRLRLPARPSGEGLTHGAQRTRSCRRRHRSAPRIAAMARLARHRRHPRRGGDRLFPVPQQSLLAHPHHRHCPAGAVARSGDRLLRRGDARSCRPVRGRSLCRRHRRRAFRRHRSDRHDRRRALRPARSPASSRGVVILRGHGLAAARAVDRASSTSSTRSPTRRRPGPAAATG